MDIKEYISSGIVEAYVLGLASVEERKSFEELAALHPELVRARIEFELALEKEAMQRAVTPPGDMKELIRENLFQSKMVSASFNWLKWTAAACLLLLAGSIYLNIRLRNQNQSLAEKNKSTEERYERMLAEMNEMKNVMQDNPAIRMVALKGTTMSPQSLTTVYWDTATHDVYLLINNLPQPPSDRQYQVWALLDGKPIDLGMIDNTYFVNQKRLLVKARNVQQAHAFAITLEKKGGNPTPEGDMYVVGNP